MKFSFARNSLLLLITLLTTLLGGCDITNSSGDDIPLEAKMIADAHYSIQTYQMQEYHIAQTYLETPSYLGTYSEWNELDWQTRSDFLPVFFVQEIPEAKTELFYQAILLYPNQFGFGWDDAVGDNLATYEWDGSSAHFDQYVALIQSVQGE